MPPLFALLFAVRLIPDPGVATYRQPHVAATGNLVAVTFGSGGNVYAVTSSDSGATFSPVVKVGQVPSLPLGMRRGPRIAISGEAILITAISSTVKGQDGEVVVWRSTDKGKTWSPPKTINDVARSAREGFQTIASNGSRVLVTWLDLRSKAMQLYGSHSSDGGVTWGPDQIIYQSPDGHICECCHTSAAVGPDGKLYAMWRNWLAGNRDMYLAVSADEGKTWKPEKLGTGSWPLNACPMDGGSLSIGPDGKLATVWRRDSTVYLDYPGQPEQELGPGKQPAVSMTATGPLIVWNEGTALKMLLPGAKSPSVLAPEGAFVSLAGTENVVAAWEEKGGINLRQIGIR